MDVYVIGPIQYALQGSVGAICFLKVGMIHSRIVIVFQAVGRPRNKHLLSNSGSQVYRG